MSVCFFFLFWWRLANTSYPERNADILQVVRKRNADMLAAEAENSDPSEQEFERPLFKKSKTKVVLDAEEESLDLALGGGGNADNEDDLPESKSIFSTGDNILLRPSIDYGDEDDMPDNAPMEDDTRNGVHSLACAI
jgi:hypothetical protein